MMSSNQLSVLLPSEAGDVHQTPERSLASLSAQLRAPTTHAASWVQHGPAMAKRRRLVRKWAKGF